MEVNPFWPSFAVDPRKTESGWSPLISEFLQRASDEFEDRFPRSGSSWPSAKERQRSQPLFLLGSRSSGGGITTAIGTLFRLLEGKALPVYIRPFRNPSAPWKALLRAFGEQLILPDRPRALHPWPEEPSRIRVFANDILGALASRLVNLGRIRDSRLRSAVRFFRRHPTKVLLEGLVPEWAQWLRQDFARIVPAAEELLSQLGLWEEDLQNWLWAIHGLAVRIEDRVVQEACRRWIFGEPVDWAQAIRANLTVAPREEAAEPPEDENGLSRRRIEDLLRLSRLSKPFLLAFDNADAWGVERPLAESAGRLLETLCESPPTFLLLGAHLGRWESSVLPFWSEKQRGLLSPPLLLREIETSEAATFLKERITRFSGSRVRLRPDWIEGVYQGANSLPARTLLLCCAVQWNRERSVDQQPSSIATRSFLDAKLQWEMFGPNLPYRWIVEWALLPPEPPADFGWG
ncbi:hypothetical protein, partial [Methylacidimicrobium cyclopophantes]|uniref:hypothetical protein n=1 Tax=Methylacidimicrobium cyclopophantes TaxID=1041766 RepID=UPI00115B82A9